MKILHPVDGSAASLRATEHVLRLNESCRPVRCTAIYVQAPILYIERFTPTPEVIDRLTQAEGRRATEPAVSRLVEAGVVHEREIAAGEPADEIVRIAAQQGFDMIVMGARGAGTLRGLLLGSVSNKVVQLAQIPVTIVR